MQPKGSKATEERPSNKKSRKKKKQSRISISEFCAVRIYRIIENKALVRDETEATISRRISRKTLLDKARSEDIGRSRRMEGINKREWCMSEK